MIPMTRTESLDPMTPMTNIGHSHNTLDDELNQRTGIPHWTSVVDELTDHLMGRATVDNVSIDILINCVKYMGCALEDAIVEINALNGLINKIEGDEELSEDTYEPMPPMTTNKEIVELARLALDTAEDEWGYASHEAEKYAHESVLEAYNIDFKTDHEWDSPFSDNIYDMVRDMSKGNTNEQILEWYDIIGFHTLGEALAGSEEE